MTHTTITAAREIHSTMPRKFMACPSCGRALSVGEIIERHCEVCERPVTPEELSASEVHRRNDMRGLQRLRDRARGAA